MDVSTATIFILIVLIWIGLWGFVETLIDMCLPSGSQGYRLLIYIIIFIVAGLVLLSVIQSNFSRSTSNENDFQ